MPQATLEFPPLYTVVGVYRLCHDPLLWRPMWESARASLNRGTLFALVWALISWPLQGLFTRSFVGHMGTVIGARHTYDAIARSAHSAGLPAPDFDSLTSILLVLNQMSIILELSMGRQLRQFRNTAYMATVASRGKPAEWWTPYVQESQHPLNVDAGGRPRSLKERLQHWAFSLLMHRLIRKGVRVVFGSVPLFGMAIYAGISALPYAQSIHKPLFAAKHMAPQQVAMWMAEREASYWTFGFVALLLERIPFFGIIFSISNRIGAAMWAHDLEKRQQRAHAGGVAPLRLEQTRTDLKDQLREGAPGTYGHPAMADVALPGDILQRPAAASGTAPPPAPPLPRRPPI